MGVFEHFPYSNFHDLNLDWILGEIMRLSESVASYNDRLDGVDDRLDGLDAEVTRIEGEIPDVVQSMGFSLDAVMSQKAVTDAINRYGGVRAIEHYHKDGQDLTPDVFRQDVVIDATGTFQTYSGGSNIICRNPPAGRYIISTAGEGEPGETGDLLAAATFSGTSPTAAGLIDTWLIPTEESRYSFEIEIPAGVGCITVNSYDDSTATPRIYKINDGVWKWDGQPENSVTTASIVDEAVTMEKIADEAVTTDKIEDLAVTREKIDNGAVGNAALAANAVSTSKFNELARVPGIQALTTAPDGSVEPYRIAILDTDPATKYAGWIYLIKETTP